MTMKMRILCYFTSVASLRSIVVLIYVGALKNRESGNVCFEALKPTGGRLLVADCTHTAFNLKAAFA